MFLKRKNAKKEILYIAAKSDGTTTNLEIRCNGTTTSVLTAWAVAGSNIIRDADARLDEVVELLREVYSKHDKITGE